MYECVCMCVCVGMTMYECVCRYVCVCVCVCGYVCVCVCGGMSMYECACMCVCVCVCVFPCVDKRVTTGMGRSGRGPLLATQSRESSGDKMAALWPHNEAQRAGAGGWRPLAPQLGPGPTQPTSIWAAHSHP